MSVYSITYMTPEIRKAFVRWCRQHDWGRTAAIVQNEVVYIRDATTSPALHRHFASLDGLLCWLKVRHLDRKPVPLPVVDWMSDRVANRYRVNCWRKIKKEW